MWLENVLERAPLINRVGARCTVTEKTALVHALGYARGLHGRYKQPTRVFLEPDMGV